MEEILEESTRSAYPFCTKFRGRVSENQDQVLSREKGAEGAKRGHNVAPNRHGHATAMVSVRHQKGLGVRPKKI